MIFEKIKEKKNKLEFKKLIRDIAKAKKDPLFVKEIKKFVKITTS